MATTLADIFERRATDKIDDDQFVEEISNFTLAAPAGWDDKTPKDDDPPGASAALMWNRGEERRDDDTPDTYGDFLYLTFTSGVDRELAMRAYSALVDKARGASGEEAPAAQK